MTEYKRPIPTVTPLLEPFFKAAKEHQLVTQQCKDCGTWVQVSLQTDQCPDCWSRNLEWKTLSGKGKVFTYNVFHQPYHPGFRDEVPYNTAVIELDEGVKFLSNIVGCANEEIKVDMPVEVCFEDVNAEVSLPKFKPAG